MSGINSSPETSPPKRAPRSIDKPKTASNQFNELNTTITSAETLFRDISPTSINVSTSVTMELMQPIIKIASSIKKSKSVCQSLHPVVRI